MRLRFFAVRDQKVEAFLPPFTARTRGEGIRLFADAVNNPETPFAKHPEDYHLFELGEFDFESGVIEGIAPSSLGSAQQYMRRDEGDSAQERRAKLG